MTEDRVSEYLRAVERELPPGWPVRETVLADLRLHVESAVEAGATEGEAMVRLGSPSAVAASLLEGYEPSLASLWDRAAAFVVDLGIGWAVLWVGLATLTLGADGVVALHWAGIGWLVAAGILALIYFPAFEAKLGRTPGKMLVGLHVVREDGHPIGWKEALLRRLPLFFEFFLLDALFAPFTKRKQRAFDIVARTVVVRSSGRAEEARTLAWLIALLLWAVPLIYVAIVNNVD